METCYIFGAACGLPQSFNKQDGDIVIAADGGFIHTEKLGIKADIVLGDFDSLGFVPDFNGEIIRHPVKKDDTDTLLAVKTGLSRGFKRFVLYGCTGKRLDHTFSNIQALSYLANNSAIGFLCGEDFVVTAIKNGKINFGEDAKGNISVFSATDRAEGVNIKGLLYPLKDAVITSDFPLGVSNEFIGESSEISVKSGILILVWHGNLDDLC